MSSSSRPPLQLRFRRRFLGCLVVLLLLGWGGCCNGDRQQGGSVVVVGGQGNVVLVDEQQDSGIASEAELAPSGACSSLDVDPLGGICPDAGNVLAAAAATATATTTTTGRFVAIRPMTYPDIRVVNRLGRDMFTAEDFCGMGRTWDDFTVVDVYVRTPELCFVAEVVEEAATAAAGGADARQTLAARKKNATVVGFLLGRASSKPETGPFGSIEWVAVAPEHRRRGVATRLVRNFQAELLRRHRASAVHARHAAASNVPAIRLLESSGLRHKIDYVSLTRPMPEVTYERFHPGSLSFEYKYVPVPRRTRSRRDGNEAGNVSITVRRVAIDDLENLRALGNDLFQDIPTLFHEWNDEEILNHYLADSDYCVVATVNKNENECEDCGSDDTGELLVGFALGSISEDTRTLRNYGYFVWLGCSSSYQGMGIATELFHTMLELFSHEQVDTIIIDTQKDNLNALKFFRRYGFGNDEDHVFLSNVPLTSM